MSKVKQVYRCDECSFESTKWLGKCSSCEAWNSFTEKFISGKADIKELVINSSVDFLHSGSQRFATGIGELDDVLGGGFLQGSITLLAGEPGIGKSTLMLQIANALNKLKILYISGEESTHQIFARAKRVNANFNDFSIVEGTSLESILAILKADQPDFVIIDSIQVISSDNAPGYAGSINQIRIVTEALMHYAKSTNTTILLIGHMNKEGDLAGPKVLEHLVDSVFLLEGDRNQHLRFFRSLKNRFGDTSEIGLFTLGERGLEELKNPTEHVLNDRVRNSIGTCLSMVIEGRRPFLIEVQALTSLTAFGYAKRSSNGYDINRLNMIIAILQKYTDLQLATQDVYVNVIGGFKINDPFCDLAIALSIISSYKKSPLDFDLVAFGELGLSGEIRFGSNTQKIIKESEKLDLKPIGKSKILKEILALYFN